MLVGDEWQGRQSSLKWSVCYREIPGHQYELEVSEYSGLVADKGIHAVPFRMMETKTAKIHFSKWTTIITVYAFSIYSSTVYLKRFIVDGGASTWGYMITDKQTGLKKYK